MRAGGRGWELLWSSVIPVIACQARGDMSFQGTLRMKSPLPPYPLIWKKQDRYISTIQAVIFFKRWLRKAMTLVFFLSFLFRNCLCSTYTDAWLTESSPEAFLHSWREGDLFLFKRHVLRRSIDISLWIQPQVEPWDEKCPVCAKRWVASGSVQGHLHSGSESPCGSSSTHWASIMESFSHSCPPSAPPGEGGQFIDWVGNRLFSHGR